MHPEMHSAIAGIRTVEKIAGIERASELELSPEGMARLDNIFNIYHGRPLQKGESPEAYSW